MKTVVIAVALLLLGACSTLKAVNTASNTPITAQQVADARDVEHGLEAAYGVALQSGLAWAKQPRCGSAGAPVAPACSTAPGILAIEKARMATRVALDKLDSAIGDVTTTTSLLDALISSAKNSYGAYEAIVNVYKPVKGN